MSPYKQIDLTRIKTIPLSSRKSKAQVKDFAQPSSKNDRIDDFLRRLPKYFKVNDLYELLKAIRQARDKDKPVIFMFGAHIVKFGLSEQTSRHFNQISKCAFGSEQGLGESIGQYLLQNKGKFRKYSLLAAAY